MKSKFALTILACSFCLTFLNAQESSKPIQPSYFKLTSSNGLIVRVYNAKENRIDDVYLRFKSKFIYCTSLTSLNVLSVSLTYC